MTCDDKHDKADIALWKGKPLTECSREELLEAIDYLLKLVESERKIAMGNLIWALGPKERFE